LLRRSLSRGDLETVAWIGRREGFPSNHLRKQAWQQLVAGCPRFQGALASKLID
jgi:hypothetical protein